MTSNHFTLLEYKFLYVSKEYEQNNSGNIGVPKPIFEQIKAFILKNQDQALFLKPAYKGGFGEVLQAQNYVGTIQAKDGSVIEILPKIAKENKEKSKEILLEMLKTLKDSPFKNYDFAHLKNARLPLLEIFIKMFLDELSNLIKKGIRSRYITQEENQKFLKGKLDITNHIKQNYAHKERFYVRFDEYKSDIVENRLLKSTLKYLYRVSKTQQARIREFLFVFEDISSSKNIVLDFSKVTLNRQMKEYEVPLLWAKTFLMQNAFTPYKGNDISFALLYDMNKLFESYVAHCLKKQNHPIMTQHKGKYLVENINKFALRPDIVFKCETKILDTKWKIISSSNDISQSDMYQLYAYGKKYNECKELYLIYPHHENRVEFKQFCFENNLVLNVCYFDLEKKQLDNFVSF